MRATGEGTCDRRVADRKSARKHMPAVMDDAWPDGKLCRALCVCVCMYVCMYQMMRGLMGSSAVHCVCVCVCICMYVCIR